MSDGPPIALPPPLACVPLASLVADGGGTFTPTGLSTSLRYALPPHASAELRDFLAPQAEASFPAPGVARLPDARVFGTGAVLSADGRFIARDVSLDFGKPFEEHWLRGFRKIRPPQRISGNLAVVATTLGHGYSHWLLEELPRWLALPRHGVDSVLAHVASPFAREARERGDWTSAVLAPRRHGHLTSTEVIVPTLGWPEPVTLAAIRDFAPGSGAADAGLGERLFVSRAKARRRRVTNEAELWNELSARGFARVVLEDLTWAQQVAAFRAARVIVAPHGAGLANLVFSAPGAMVVECFDRRYVNACYWKIAAVGQLDYRPVVPTGDSPLAQESNANREDLAADVPAILRALTAT